MCRVVIDDMICCSEKFEAVVPACLGKASGVVRATSASHVPTLPPKENLLSSLGAMTQEPLAVY